MAGQMYLTPLRDQADGSDLYEVDRTTGALTLVGNMVLPGTQSNIWASFYDPFNDRLLAVTGNDDGTFGWSLVEVSRVDGSMSLVVALDPTYADEYTKFACRGDGTIFCVHVGPLALATLDPTTGLFTDFGVEEPWFSWDGAFCFDGDDRLFFAPSVFSPLLEIDQVTGAAAFICQYLNEHDWWDFFGDAVDDAGGFYVATDNYPTPKLETLSDNGRVTSIALLSVPGAPPNANMYRGLVWCGDRGSTSFIAANPYDATPPANDDFTNATPLAGASGAIIGSSEGATDETDDPAPPWDTRAQRPVWYTLTVPTSQNYDLWVDRPTDPAVKNIIDSVLSIYTGAAINALTVVDRRDDAEDGRHVPSWGVGSEVNDVALVVGTTYVIEVSSFDRETRGEFTLNWAPSTPSGFPSVGGVGPQIGEAGDTVVIGGTGLTGATDVEFNGVPATSFVVDSDTSITAVVPATSTGPVSVTTPAGTAASSFDFHFGFAAAVAHVHHSLVDVGAIIGEALSVRRHRMLADRGAFVRELLHNNTPVPVSAAPLPQAVIETAGVLAELLENLMPELADSPEVRQALLALGDELARIEATAYQMLAKMLPQNADDQFLALSTWEALLGLPVGGSAGATDAERRAVVVAVAGGRRRSSAGAWGQVITGILGSSSWTATATGAYEVTLSASPGSAYTAGQLLEVARKVTPAHLNLLI